MLTLMSELERIRASRGWTDAEMAKHLGVSRAMYTMVRSGRRRPGRRFLTAVKRAFEWLDLNFYFASESRNSDRLVAERNRMPAEAPVSHAERFAAGSEYSDTREAPDGR